MYRRTVLLAGAALPLIHTTAFAQSSEAVNVLYAGSLVNLMEHSIGPAFDKTGSGRFQGYAGGSNKVANEIKGKLRRGDVFISANPKVNNDLMSAANGGWVTWYVTFAASPLVIGYNKSSRFAAALQSKPWYDVLQEPGIHIGRTDPKLDPKGKLTIDLLDKAAEVTKQPGLTQKVLGAPENPAQVFPEENLVGRLQSGELDVGFFYSTETADLHIPAISPGPGMVLSAHYTATILHDAPNPTGAEQFIAFLLSRAGQALMHEHGLEVLPPTIEGDATAVPASLHAVLTTAK